MNHEFADLSVWNPIKYWADKAKQDLINNNRSRAMVHAGYAMHFAQDYLNPPHLGPLLWGSYQEVDWPLELELVWENNDFYYVPKAWSFNDFRIFGRCFTSDDAFAISFENDLLSYRHSTALAWPAPLPSMAWIIEQGDEGILLDRRIANAVMWSEQAAHEVLQYVFDLKPPGGCRPISCDFDSDLKTDIAVYRASTGAWYVKPSSGASPYGIGWGGDPSDKPVPGDYDGDGKTDIAVYRTRAGRLVCLSLQVEDPLMDLAGVEMQPINQPLVIMTGIARRTSLSTQPLLAPGTSNLLRVRRPMAWVGEETQVINLFLVITMEMGRLTSLSIEPILAPGTSNLLRVRRPMAWVGEETQVINLFPAITMGMEKQTSPSTVPRTVAGR